MLGATATGITFVIVRATRAPVAAQVAADAARVAVDAPSIATIDAAMVVVDAALAVPVHASPDAAIEVDAAITTGTLVIRPQHSGIRLAIDGKAADANKQITLAPGRHTVVGYFKGAATTLQVVIHARREQVVPIQVRPGAPSVDDPENNGLR